MVASKSQKQYETDSELDTHGSRLQSLNIKGFAVRVNPAVLIAHLTDCSNFRQERKELGLPSFHSLHIGSKLCLDPTPITKQLFD